MATPDVNNFLESLCRFLAGRAGVEYVNTPRALWRNQVNETVAAHVAKPHSVIRFYGGPPLNWDPMPRASLQVMTAHEDPSAALARAYKLFDAFCDEQGVPLAMQTIDGFTTAGVADGTWRLADVQSVQRPNPVGVDSQRRNLVAFNADVAFFKLS